MSALHAKAAWWRGSRTWAVVKGVVVAAVVDWAVDCGMCRALIKGC
jgi:hypothetical protein